MPSNYTLTNGKDRNGKLRYRPDKKKFLYNIDTLWLNADASNYDEVMENGLLDKLELGRSYYLDNDLNSVIEISITGYKNPLLFKIFGGQAPLYQFSIRNDDMAIYFSRRSRIDQMPMKIQINQFILWSKGVEKAFFEALCVLTSLGFAPSGTKLNRIDFAVHSDQWNWNLRDLEKFEYPKNIAKDNFPDFYRLNPVTGEFQTVQVGDRTRCQIRIYQKSIEAKKKGKTYFLDLYESLGMDKDNVWNIEIEVRRDFIKECKDFNGEPLFDDFEKVLNENRLSDLWSYLMDRYHHPSKFWTYLKDGAVDKKFYNVDGFELIREKDIDSNFDREVAQIAGRLKLAVLDKEDYSFENAIKIFKDKFYEIEVKQKKKDWLEEVEMRKRFLHNNEINKKINRDIKSKKKKDTQSPNN
ncbi:replication initiation protein [Heyndrickxia oleronia]|uniref:replication initiation protein n=1 Tax=Heyndrickxia oleronia TaxID=38875 RepID=UPI0037500675